MKKAIIFVLVAAMCLSFAGCKEEKPKANLNLSYEIGDTGGLEVPFANGEEIRMTSLSTVQSGATYIFERLSEITGLKVIVEPIPTSAYKEKIKVLLASKNLPDIIGDGLGTLQELNDLAMQGAFASVNDYIDVMPNFKKRFGEGSEYEWIFKSYAAADGKMYTIPTSDNNRDVNHGVLYRKDIFDKYGIEMWNSPETFYQVLKTLKEKDPDCVPFTAKSKEWLINNLGTSWGIEAFKPFFDEEEKVWKYSDTSDEMKDLLNYVKKLYSEGLLDPEFLTLTQADWTKKMTSNMSYVTWDWIGRLEMFAEQSEVEGYDLRYGNPIGPKQTIITLPKVSAVGSAVAKNNKSELSMKLIDFLYSDAGAELMTLGIKGVTYEFDEDGKAKYLEFEEGAKVEITALEEKYGMFMQGTYKRIDKRSCYFNYTQKEQEAQDLAVNNDMFEPADPVLAFAADDQSKINDYQTELNTAFNEFMYKYIVGGDATWEDWLKQAEKLGVNELVEIYNKTHKAMGF